MPSINLNALAVRVTRDYINDLIESKFALRVELARVEAERETLRARVASLETVLDFLLDKMFLRHNERDSDNEYTPWLNEGITEIEYFHRLYLEQSNKSFTLAELWRSRPAGLARFAKSYGNSEWVDAFEKALGVEK